MKQLALAAIIAYGIYAPLTASAQSTDAFNPANGHLYRLVWAPTRTWTQASTAAQAMTVQGVPGHLATITSAEEHAFIQVSLGQPIGFQVWLGGFQPAGSLEPAGGWQWVTGEPFAYTNWRQPSEPNNNGNENLLTMFANDMTWNDLGVLDHLGQTSRHAYLIEFAIPEPSASLLTMAALASWGVTRSRRQAL